MSYEFACQLIREGDNAVLLDDVNSGEEIWIPLSQVESMHFNEKGEGTIVVTDWIARKKGLL